MKQLSFRAWIISLLFFTGNFLYVVVFQHKIYNQVPDIFAQSLVLAVIIGFFAFLSYIVSLITTGKKSSHHKSVVASKSHDNNKQSFLFKPINTGYLVLVLLLMVFYASQVARTGSLVLGFRTEITPTPSPIQVILPSVSPTEKIPNYPCTGKNSGNTVYVDDSNDCIANYTDCELNDGSWKTMSKSACSIAQGRVSSGSKIDCIGPDNKHFQATQKECDDFNAAWGKSSKPIQGNNQNQQNTQIKIPTYKNTYVDNSITCVVSYPCTGNTYTYKLLPADCTNAQSQAASLCNTFPKTTSAPPVYTTVASTPDQALIQAHKQACDSAVADWVSYKENFMNTQYGSYSTSAQAIMALESQRQKIQAELYAAGCSNTISL